MWLARCEEELGEFEAEYGPEGQRAYYPTADVRLCAGAQEDQGSGIGGRKWTGPGEFPVTECGDGTDGKGVDRFDASADRTVSGAGQSCGGSGRRCCAAVVVLVVRTDAGTERTSAAGRCGVSRGCGNRCAGDPVRVAGVENSGEEPISQTDPGHCDAELIRAGLHGGTGGERDHFIMVPR